MTSDALGRQRYDADRRYNDALTALDRAIVTVSRLPAVDRAQRELVATALMEFLPQITGFVDSKDRELRDFTHVRPVHPDTLQYLLRASGFARVEILYSAPVPDHIILNNLLFTHLDYAAIGYRS